MKDVMLTILQVVLIAVIPVIAAYVCRFLKAKRDEVEAGETVGMSDFIIREALDAVIAAVSYVCQTYVDGLKKSGKFSVENQKYAFQLAYDKASLIIAQETKDFIADIYGSFSAWLTMQIEAQVRMQKETPIVEYSGNPCGFLTPGEEKTEEGEEDEEEIAEDHPPDEGDMDE